MHCTCGKDGKMGYTRLADDLWVCANCKRPTRMVFTKLTLNHAPRQATGISSVIGDDAGRNILTWTTTVSGEKIKTMMFHAYPRKVDMDQGRNICLELWKSLDASITGIREATIHSDQEWHKFRARAQCEVIALIMAPFYENADAVGHEALKRYDARKEGRDHESPGLAEAIWNPNTRFDGTPYSEESESKARRSPAKPKVALDDQKVNFIKHCLSTGSQTPEVLAGMFSVSVDDIKALA